MIGHSVINDISKSGEIFGFAEMHDGGLYCSKPVEIENYCTTAKKSNYDDSKNNWYKWGSSDSHPDFLLKLYRESTVQKSIIEYKSNVIKGNGFEFYVEKEGYQLRNGKYIYIQNDYSDSEIQRITGMAKAWAMNIDLQNYISKAASSCALFGGYLGLRYIQASSELQRRTELQRVEAIELNKVRNSVNMYYIDGKNNHTHYFISPCFQRASMYDVRSFQNKGAKVKRVQNFDSTSYQNFGVYANFVGNITPFREIYPTPDYESKKTINYFQADYLLSEHDLKGVTDNFSLDIIIVRYRKKSNDPVKEAAAKEADLHFIQQNYKGATGKRSSVMWVDPEKKSNGETELLDPIKIIEIPHNTNPERYNNLRDERDVTILNAHGIVNPAIVGMPNTARTGFSDSAEYLDISTKQLIFSRIRPFRELIQNDIDNLLSIEGIPARIRIKESVPILKTPSDKIMEQVFTKDEQRNMYGYKQLTDEQKNELNGL